MTSLRHLGARIIFRHGSVALAPAVPLPRGWTAARYSVVSPGTELRRLIATASGAEHAAGYMTVGGQPDGQQWLAPVPHGAAARPDDERALPIPAAIRPEHVAVARFQMMAALGLDGWASRCRAQDSVVVLGGGPVAIGCVLELQRLGAAHITVVTRHPRPAIAGMQDIIVLTRLPGGAAHPVVIDCTGRPADALEMVSADGLLGLLGTPADESHLSSVAVHRRSVAVVGMHELAGNLDKARRVRFQTVLQWVTTAVDVDALPGWFDTIPGEHAPRFYAALASTQRPDQPFVLLDWL